MTDDRKVALVTGATNGIGEVTAHELAHAGYHVIITARDRARGERVLGELRAASGYAGHELHVGDLSSMADVRRIALEVREAHSRLHLLVNNAGGLFTERRATVDGFEHTLALNHLAYFLMTRLLLSNLRAAGTARVISVASDAHRSGRIHWDDLEGARRYVGFRAYGQSKLMNVMFAFALARRLRGSGVTSNALHPGVVGTGFYDNAKGPLRPVFALVKRYFTITPEQGARSTLHLALSDEVQRVSGEYFDEKGRPVRASRAAYDEAAQERLWTRSELYVSRWLDPSVAEGT